MPLYDYVCAACGRSFEVIHGVHGEPPTSCPLCGKGPVRKAITAPAVHYKGSGWAKKERRAVVKTGAPSGGDDGSSTDKGSSGTEGGASKESGSSSTDGPSPVAPAASAAGESPKGTARSSKSGTATKSADRDRD